MCLKFGSNSSAIRGRAQDFFTLNQHLAGLDRFLILKRHLAGLDRFLIPKQHLSGLDCFLIPQRHLAGLDRFLIPQRHLAGLDRLGRPPLRKTMSCRRERPKPEGAGVGSRIPCGRPRQNSKLNPTFSSQRRCGCPAIAGAVVIKSSSATFPPGCARGRTEFYVSSILGKQIDHGRQKARAC
jgi:hypothetical protein